MRYVGHGAQWRGPSGGRKVDEQPNEDGDSRPKFFKSINGWIAGATGLVIALGGLATAYRELVPKEPGAQPVANTQTAASNEATAAQPAAATQANEDPWGYTTDQGGALHY